MRLRSALLLPLTSCVLFVPAAQPAAAAAPSADARAAAAAAACVRVRENQQVRLTGTLRKDTFTESYGGGGQPQDANHKVIRSRMGGLGVAASTCKNRNGRWRVLSPIRLTPDYNRLSSSLEITKGRMGWGLVPRAQLPKSAALRVGGLRIEATECTKGSLFSFLSAVSDLPIPGISYVVSVGQYLTGQALPADRTRCQRLVAPLDVAFKVAPDGTLAVGRARTSTTYQAQDLGDLKIKVRMDVSVRPG